MSGAFQRVTNLRPNLISQLVDNLIRLEKILRGPFIKTTNMTHMSIRI